MKIRYNTRSSKQEKNCYIKCVSFFPLWNSNLEGYKPFVLIYHSEKKKAIKSGIRAVLFERYFIKWKMVIGSSSYSCLKQRIRQKVFRKKTHAHIILTKFGCRRKLSFFRFFSHTFTCMQILWSFL